MPVGGKEPYNWPSPLTELARSQAWRVQSGHLHLLIWQETQMEGNRHFLSIYQVPGSMQVF